MNPKPLPALPRTMSIFAMIGGLGPVVATQHLSTAVMRSETLTVTILVVGGAVGALAGWFVHHWLRARLPGGGSRLIPPASRVTTSRA